MGLHIVLYEPEIPANTGNIARTCLATDTTLHLIHPLGFSTEDKMVQKAGLDYWKHVNVTEYDSIEELYETYRNGLYYYIENYGEKHYTDVDFNQLDKEMLFDFGTDTIEIHKEVIKGNEESCLRIPMNDQVRSLNLSNTAAIIIYEAMRQQGFQNII